LTLILGARCIDGVVIVGDSKITDVMGTLLRYEPKYAGALRNVLFGYSGVVHMFKVFERYVVGDVAILLDSKDKYTPENLLRRKYLTKCTYFSRTGATNILISE
jgi:20S proteasome alpha/beta subunit